jgi:transposase-like protein
MHLMDVYERFPTEEHCRRFLERRRWPVRVLCIRCHSSRIGEYMSVGKSGKDRKVFECLDCAYQFTVTTGTIFHDSHLDLRKWFLALALIIDAKKGIAANQVKRHLKCSYKTAWHVCHRIREAMQDPTNAKLAGIVEIDECYLGGERSVAERHKNKMPVLGAIERGGNVRLRKTPETTVDGKRARDFINDVVDSEAGMICTDESPLYPQALAHKWAGKHQTVKHSAKEYVRGIVYTNTIEGTFSLLKRGIIGNFHQVSHKHLDRYLAEFEYRFNNRKNPDLFGKVAQNALDRKPLTYKALIGAETVDK